MPQAYGEVIVALGCLVLVSIGLEVVAKGSGLATRDMVFKIIGGGLVIATGIAMHYFEAVMPQGGIRMLQSLGALLALVGSFILVTLGFDMARGGGDKVGGQARLGVGGAFVVVGIVLWHLQF